jgi:ABC-type glycerol-3-phosphate transport system substrate-binding protein
MQIKPRVLLFPLVCCCLALAGCSQLSPLASKVAPAASSTPTPHGLQLITPTPTPSQPTGTVSIWHSLQDDELPALLRPIEEFRKAYPGVQFDVTYVPSLDLRAAYEQAALQGKAPTVLIGSAGWGPSLYDQGLVADLSSLAEQGLLDSLNPAGVETGRYKDALISLPLSLEGTVLYRNGALAPIAPATFDELVTFARSATEGGAVGAVLDRGFMASGAHLNGLGGKWINPDGTPAFNDEHGIAWVNLLGAFEQAGPVEYQTDADLNLFKEGRAGMIIEDTRQRQNLAEAIGADNLVIDPWPLATGGALSGFVQADGVFLNPRALQEGDQVSWEFVKTLFSPQSQAGLAQLGFIPAINLTQLTAAGEAARIEDPLISQAMNALAGGAAYPVQPQFQLYLPYLDIAIQSIFNGEASTGDALQAAEDAILAELKATPAP